MSCSPHSKLQLLQQLFMSCMARCTVGVADHCPRVPPPAPQEKLQSAKQEVEAAIGSESQDKQVSDVHAGIPPFHQLLRLTCVQGVCCVSVDVSGSDEEVAGAIEKVGWFIPFKLGTWVPSC